jgi:hypothetical protein
MASQRLVPHRREGRVVVFRTDHLQAWLDGSGTTFPGGWRREKAT